MNNIAKIIKVLMKKYNLTQVDFAVRSEIPLPTVRKYLRSEFNPTKKNIEKIEFNFQIEIKRLLKINFSVSDEMEEIEYIYKKKLEEEENKLRDFEAREWVMETNYNDARRDYEEKNGNDFFDDMNELRNSITVTHNTIILIQDIFNTITKDSKEEIIEKIEKNNNSFFKITDNKLIELLRLFNISIVFKNQKTILKSSSLKNEIIIENEVFQKILELLKKDIRYNLKKYIDILNQMPIENEKDTDWIQLAKLLPSQNDWTDRASISLGLN